MSFVYDPRNDNAALTIARKALFITSQNYISDIFQQTFIQSNENISGAITLTTNGGHSESIIIQSLQGTGGNSVSITSTNGGITINANKSVTITGTNDGVGILSDSGSIGLVSNNYAVLLGTDGFFTVPSLAVNIGYYVINADKDISPASSGATYRIELTGDTTILLPSVGNGLNFKFFATHSGHNLTFEIYGGGTNFYGTIMCGGTLRSKNAGSGSIGAGPVTSGDNFSFISDGSLWFINGTTSNIF